MNNKDKIKCLYVETEHKDIRLENNKEMTTCNKYKHLVVICSDQETEMTARITTVKQVIGCIMDYSRIWKIKTKETQNIWNYDQKYSVIWKQTWRLTDNIKCYVEVVVINPIKDRQQYIVRNEEVK